MTLIAILVVIGMLLGGMWWLSRVLKAQKRRGKQLGASPVDKALPGAGAAYVRQGRLLSLTEQEFFTTLRDAVGPAFTVLAQVPLSRVICPSRAAERRARTIANNRIDRKIIDFVLVDPVTMNVELVIELNDSSHSRADRIHRDAFLESALLQAGIRFLPVPAAGSYSRDKVASAVSAAVAQKA